MDINVEKSLRYLAFTDEDHAKAKARVKFLDHKRKVVRSQCFLEVEGKTVPEREARAETHEDYRLLLDEYEEAVYAEALLASKRKSAELAIEIWRSEGANRRQSNI